MSRTGYVDVVGGAAGDMLLAALLDAGAPLRGVVDAVEAVLPGCFTLSLDSVKRAGLRASLLRATPSGGSRTDAHRTVRELHNVIQSSSLPKGIGRVARDVLTKLSEAEARVHGLDVEDLVLDELGSDDTLLDIVGVAAALHDLEVDQLFVSSVPMAFGGELAGTHAGWPVPAPATLDLLRGFAIRGVKNGELVTPTAAAVFSTLGRGATEPPAMTVEAIGYGAGTRDWKRRPNVVRVLVGSAAETPGERTLSLLETNLDDLSPQLVADAVAALRAAGALDAWTVPAQMKKDRPGIVLAALCEPQAEAVIERVFFETTPTFGVRVQAIRRIELDRSVRTVTLTNGSVRVKVGTLHDRVMSATPEHDDVAELARRTRQPVRMLYDEAVAAAHGLLGQGVQPDTTRTEDG